jgi:molecular chaperone GrpE
MLLGWIVAIALALVAAAIAFQAQRERRSLIDASLAQREAASLELTQAHDKHAAQLARIEREASTARARAPLDLANDLLPAIDALEQARQHAAQQDASLDGFISGLDLAIRELERALARHQITAVRPAPDDAFDPAIHEAVQVSAPPDGVSPGHVIDCLRSGWSHPARVLRPAMVRVAARSAPQPLAAPSPAPDVAAASEAAADVEAADAASAEPAPSA